MVCYGTINCATFNCNIVKTHKEMVYTGLGRGAYTGRKRYDNMILVGPVQVSICLRLRVRLIHPGCLMQRVNLEIVIDACLIFPNETLNIRKFLPHHDEMSNKFQNVK